MRPRLRALAPVLLALSGCAASDNPSSAGEQALTAARDQVSRRIDQYAALLLNPEVSTLLDFWTPDAVVQEPGLEISTAEQRKLAHEFFASNSISEFKMITTELSAHDAGAVVYQTGYYSEMVQPRDGKTPASTYRQNFLARWVRGADSVWRFQRFLATPRPEIGEVLPVPALPDEPVGSVDARLAAAQITERMNDYTTTMRANQPIAIAAYWREDGQFYEPDVQLAGKPALAQLFQAAFTTTRIIDYQYQTSELHVHDQGSVAYQFGGFSETFEPRDAHRPAVTVRKNFVARWRRGADGRWRIDRFFATPAQPAAQSSASPASAPPDSTIGR